MCLAIPARIVAIEDNIATIDVDGVQRRTSLMLVDDAEVGDYVIFHAGYALSIIDEAEALKSLTLLREVYGASL